MPADLESLLKLPEYKYVVIKLMAIGVLRKGARKRPERWVLAAVTKTLEDAQKVANKENSKQKSLKYQALIYPKQWFLKQGFPETTNMSNRDFEQEQEVDPNDFQYE